MHTVSMVKLCVWLCVAGENEDEKLNEVMHEAWRFNRDCKLLRDGLQGLSWDGKHNILHGYSIQCRAMAASTYNNTHFYGGENPQMNGKF